MKNAKLLLWIGAIGLFPIALSYGLAPELSIPMLFDIEVTSPGLVHIFRAVMGLYFGMIFLWVWGATNEKMTIPAVYALMFFMFGLAGGRVLSLVLEGMVNWLLEVYMLLEFGLGFAALAILKKINQK